MTKKVHEQVADEQYRLFKMAGYSEDRARREQAATREYGRRMAEQRSKGKR
ncbi:hypothetical protein [Actinoplanes regularis]|uniref:hypothetical protein n=1 Tax=Actinoplanes regularis TaxID=52697 RepID=UPI0024A16E60|nr:hypothetical protein [Actinoplanes regularis]GLW30163.1 hypothetical protein Areg01_31030 [Actinoplanes regularis]